MNADSALTNRERVDYYDELLGTIALAATGGILFTVGLLWGVSGMETFIVDTGTGITLVEGGASDGFLKGPLVAALGVVFLAFAQAWYAGVSR
jgi:hypothetical protein